MREQAPALRTNNFDEVACGYSFEEALRESERCLMCADQPCVAGCPVGINIPGFVRKLTERNYRGAYDVLTDTNLLPSVCGRVCPQENQCEKACTVGESLEPVAIGTLERFVGDVAISEGWINVASIEPNRFRVGIVGSGPAGMACAADMAKAGCDVTVYESCRLPGGVLRYGIPDFRLPNAVIDADIDNLKHIGVKFECNTLVGRRFTIEQMLDEMGFHAVFVGAGIGYPTQLDIPGDALNGVLSAADLLTRCNRKRARKVSEADAPLPVGRRVAVVGADNPAIDAARVAIRLGAQKVFCIDRHECAEASARMEEIHHAEREGVEFHWLTRPLSIVDDGTGSARGLRCVRMDAGTEFELEADQIVYSLGTNANPAMGRTTRLALNPRGYVIADENLAASVPGVFAGGDIVTGSITVIKAMGAGRKAARGMKAYLRIRDVTRPYRIADGSGALFGIDNNEWNFTPLKIAGKQPDEHLDAIDEASLRPALFAGYRDLTALRYDFPLLLPDDANDMVVALPLSALIDRALEAAARGLDCERVRKHAIRVELQIRRLVAAGQSGSFSALWDKAVSHLAKTADNAFGDSVRRSRGAITLDGELADCDAALPSRLLRHLWAAVERRKAEASRAAHEAMGTQEAFAAALLFHSCADALDAIRKCLPQRRDLARFPAALVCVKATALQAAEHDRLMEILASDLPIKVLVQIDDILGESAAYRKLALTAVGLKRAYVLQTASSHLARCKEQLLDGLNYSGPALFSVFSGASGIASGLPPYLTAAAAMESRAFPAFAYDPGAGPNPASRLSLNANPQVDIDWPVHAFAFEDEQHQRVSEEIAFTLADFVASDNRYSRHLERWCKDMPDVGSVLLMVDAEDVLQKVAVDQALIAEAGLCREMWHSLQDLAGVQRYDSPAAKRVAQNASRSPDAAYIETRRCSTCDACITINKEMFAYDSNRQAYIADLDAGTYAQLVEAAESCQVSVIHPGKPRNQTEPGLKELLKRAEPFQ